MIPRNTVARSVFFFVLAAVCLFPVSASLGGEGGKSSVDPKYFHKDPAIGFSFPNIVGGVEASGRVDYEEQLKGAGYSIAYASQPGETINVYIYDSGKPASEIGNGTELPAVARELKNAIGSIDTLQKAGMYEDVRAIDKIFPAIREATGDLFLLQGFSLMNRSVSDGRLETIVMIRGFRGKFMKIRATYTAPALDGGEGARHVASFVKDFRTLLVSAGK